jgi:hypothetical protein
VRRCIATGGLSGKRTHATLCQTFLEEPPIFPTIRPIRFPSGTTAAVPGKGLRNRGARPVLAAVPAFMRGAVACASTALARCGFAGHRPRRLERSPSSRPTRRSGALALARVPRRRCDGHPRRRLPRSHTAARRLRVHHAEPLWTRSPRSDRWRRHRDESRGQPGPIASRSRAGIAHALPVTRNARGAFASVRRTFTLSAACSKEI